MTPGSASGLENSACMTVPATARLAPTRRPRTMRGNRICHNADSARRSANGPPKTPLTTSVASTRYCPTIAKSSTRQHTMTTRMMKVATRVRARRAIPVRAVAGWARALI